MQGGVDTAAPDRRPTIVIVDDSSDVRTLVRTEVRLSGRFDVVGEGANGLDAVALASRHRPDLLLLDVSMPVVDGLAALPKVRDASPSTHVVMYSGFEEAGLASRAKELGAAAFVSKSAPFDVLLDALAAQVGREQIAGAGARRPPRQELDPVLSDHLERFREVFEDAAIGMATMTLAGRIVRANRSLGQLLDTPVEDLVGVALADLAEEPQAIGDALLGLDAGEPVVQVEHRMQGRGERTFWSTMSQVIDAHGRPLYVFLQVQDTSRQRSAEADLRRAEVPFRLLVEAVQDYAIYMLDPAGRISSWNAGAERSNGYTADEIIGQHFRVFYPSEQQARKHPEHELEEAVRHGTYDEEGWRVRKDGSQFWASVTITAVRDAEGELVGFAKVTRDTTERREMMQRLEEANRRLAEASARQADFFAVTAHELRAPIGVLSGATTTLVRNLDVLTDHDRSEITTAVVRSSAHLRRLLDDLLTAARVEADRLALEPAEVDLADHLHTTVGGLVQSHGAGVVDVAVEPGLHVRADPVRLTQIVGNLVTNALRHGRPPVRVSAAGRADEVEIAVRDAGGGVPEELQERLFERFVTGSPDGTGLGLFLVRELARAHGGDATYRVSDGTFLVSLPREPA
ncbi:MAG TPA: PAS domain S-box protein [Marmoricola sp.]|nr:PAS domain S-box protein [Marmoricola sp.]